MNNINFTAVDFETVLYKPDPKVTGVYYIVQIGLVVVKNGVIVEKYKHLVKPPFTKFDNASMRVHHIHPVDVANEPSFDELWPTISHYFLNTKLVAHKKSTEENILNRYLDEMGDMTMGLNHFDCTCEAYKKKKLSVVCAGFGIPFDETAHHDALYDAIKCAEVAIHMYSGEQPDWNVIERLSPTKIKSTTKRHKALSGDILVKNLEDADPDSPFYDRKVVITGEFEFDRDYVAHKIWELGADIDKSISKKTNFVVIGKDPGLKKIEAVDKLIYNGYNIRKLDEFDLHQIFDGVWGPYKGDKNVSKSLDFTYEHFSRHHIAFKNGRNVMASKELFIGDGLAGDKRFFDVILGNLGAFDTIDLGADTQICVLSESTVRKLEDGIKDKTILLIEDFYNKNRSVVFDFTFLTEKDIVDFCRERCYACGDKLTMSYLDKYLDSIKH